MAQALRRRLDRWDRVWQECVDEAPTPEAGVLAVFDALARHRQLLGPSRWCAFLGATAETPSRGPELDGILADDTRLLTTRLRELAEPVVGTVRAEAVARQLVLIYTGVLGMILRGVDADTAVADGRRIGAAVLGTAVVGSAASGGA